MLQLKNLKVIKTTVIMDKQDYFVLREVPAHKTIPTDSTTHLDKTAKAKTKARKVSELVKTGSIPKEKSPVCPKLFGLSIIHKPKTTTTTDNYREHS